MSKIKKVNFDEAYLRSSSGHFYLHHPFVHSCDYWMVFLLTIFTLERAFLNWFVSWSYFWKGIFDNFSSLTISKSHNLQFDTKRSEVSQCLLAELLWGHGGVKQLFLFFFSNVMRYVVGWSSGSMSTDREGTLLRLMFLLILILHWCCTDNALILHWYCTGTVCFVCRRMLYGEDTA